MSRRPCLDRDRLGLGNGCAPSDRCDEMSRGWVPQDSRAPTTPHGGSGTSDYERPYGRQCGWVRHHLSQVRCFGEPMDDRTSE
jgi:hypothetical protein